MKIRFTDDFFFLLNEQFQYISLNKPFAAKKFKKDLIQNLKRDLVFPFHYKKSIYFDNEHVRDFFLRLYLCLPV